MNILLRIIGAIVVGVISGLFYTFLTKDYNGGIIVCMITSQVSYYGQKWEKS